MCLAVPIMIIDFHNDTLLKLDLLGGSFFDNHKDVCCDWQKMRKADVAGAFFSIWANPAFFDGGEVEAFIKKKVDEARRLLESSEHKTSIYRCDSKQKSFSKNQIGIFLSVEGGYVLNNSPLKAEYLRSLGIRKLTLTHFQSLEWAACSSDDKTGHGLTSLGKEIIHALNENGIIIDIAHAATRTILDAAKHSKSPIVYSHGGARGIYSNSRCIADDAIRAVASTGGVVGISFFPEHLTSVAHKEDGFRKFWEDIEILKSNKELSPCQKGEAEIRKLLFEYPRPEKIPGLENVFRHIDYVVQLVGEDSVAIGSDFDGVPYTCRGLEDISKIRALIPIMKKANYSNERIKKIMGGNIERLVRSFS